MNMQAAVMQEAWTLYRRSRNPALAFDRNWFRRSLRLAWSNVKMRIWRASLTETGRIRAAIDNLRNKDTWTAADYVEHDRLQAELRIAEAPTVSIAAE